MIGLNDRLAALGGEGGENGLGAGSDGDNEQEKGASAGTADLSVELSLLVSLYVKGAFWCIAGELGALTRRRVAVLPRIKTVSPEKFLDRKSVV